MNKNKPCGTSWSQCSPRRDTFNKDGAAKIRRKEASCEGKVRHATKSAAVIALAKMRKIPWQKLKKPAPDGFDIYECRHCGGWHVGAVGKGRKCARRTACVDLFINANHQYGTMVYSFFCPPAAKSPWRPAVGSKKLVLCSAKSCGHSPYPQAPPWGSCQPRAD